MPKFNTNLIRAPAIRILALAANADNAKIPSGSGVDVFQLARNSRGTRSRFGLATVIGATAANAETVDPKIELSF